MIVELVFWLGWIVPSAVFVTHDQPGLALLPPASYALAWAWWSGSHPRWYVIAAAATSAAVLLGWHLRRRRELGRAQALERLEEAWSAWWRAMRAHTTSRAGFCARLLAYAAAAHECASALRELERYGIDVPLSAPPQPPELRPEAQRPGPAWLWEQFDSCHRAASHRASLNPSGDCQVLSEVALELFRRIDRGDPAVPAHVGGICGDEHPGPLGAMVHALCAPAIAGITAANVSVQDDGNVAVDVGVLMEQVERSGTGAQRTLVALAHVVGDRPVDDVTVGELLELEDTDLAHALEAIALRRGLRRIYPSQRPDSLWLRAAMTDDGA